jgi:hypothetical protein
VKTSEVRSSPHQTSSLDSRLSPDEHPRIPPEENRDKYGGLVEDITAFMVSLGYPGSAGFLGGLSGAYVLSCPASYTQQVEDPIYSSVADHYRPRGFTEEEVHMMVLLRYPWAVGSQELAWAASDALPLRYMHAGQPWSFVELHHRLADLASASAAAAFDQERLVRLHVL